MKKGRYAVGPASHMVKESIQAFVPAFNEEGTIRTVLERTHEVLSKNCRSFEVLAYDDGSTDSTPSICDKFAREFKNVRVVHRAKNGGGWGPMVKYAFLQCEYDWITIVDSDMQFDPYDLAKFIPYLKDYDIVISGRENRKDNLARKAVTYMDKLFLKLLFGVSFYDLHWIKFIRTDFIDKSTITGNSPFIETDILVRARKKGARVKEFYLPHYPRTQGQATGASLKNIYTSMKDMLSLYLKLKREGARP
ncbi:MAG: glycosyltransferase family 2 protein [Deltaproteobacteria bacterium]|nr:glycosyltransferase family 2 protein [Deltaproteobacteria bacterium]